MPLIEHLLCSRRGMKYFTRYVINPEHWPASYHYFLLQNPSLLSDLSHGPPHCSLGKPSLDWKSDHMTLDWLMRTL